MRRSAVLSALAVCAFVACSSKDAGKERQLVVTAAGDAEARSGFAFPPSSPGDPAFVDGWAVKLERVLVTVDAVVLADGPDTSPTDQSRTGGAVVVANGPWAVDLSRPGNADFLAGAKSLKPRGDEEGETPEAQPLVRITKRDDGGDLDPSARYAFGFDLVTASANAKKTNLDAAAEADYAEMVSKGWSLLYVGTATFKGKDCKSSDPSYDFTRLPKSVRFRFGFKTPAKYINCQNTSLHGKAFAGEEAQRGVQLGDGTTIAQITAHVDHPFWDTVDHDAAQLFFDQMAIAATADGTLTLDDLAALDPTSFKDRAGKELPWRSCIADRAPRDGARKFDSGSVPVDKTAPPDRALRSYADYVAYQVSTMGHLAADGLCAVERAFASPR